MRVLHRNLMREATIWGFFDEATGYSYHRLYDGMFSRNWKSSFSTYNQSLIICSGTSTPVDALIIPGSHTLDGKQLGWAYYPASHSNLCLNPSFADDLGSWTQVAGTGTIARTTTGGEYYSAPAAVKLTAGAGANTYIYQSFSVAQGEILYCTVYTRGDVTNAGRVGIYDQTGGAYIVPPISTNIPGATFVQTTVAAVIPYSCTGALLTLHCPLTGACCFDDVDVYKWTSAVTPWLQSGSGQILKELGAPVTSTGWAFGIAAIYTPHQMSELYLGKIVTLDNPSTRARRQTKRFSVDVDSPSGDPSSLLLGTARNILSFSDTYVDASDLSNWEDWFTVYGTHNRFWIEDHNSDQYFGMFDGAPVIDDLDTGDAMVSASIRQVG